MMKQVMWLAAAAGVLLMSAARADVSNDGLWSDMREAALANTGERTVLPSSYRTLSLNLSAMTERLARAPAWHAEEGRRDLNAVTLTLPHPDGRFLEFRVWRSNVVSPELAARYPELSTYRGVALDDGGERVWLDLTTKGFHAMVRGAEGSWFIDPYSRFDTGSYISYRRADLPVPDELPKLMPPVDERSLAERTRDTTGARAVGDELRTYRLAMAATGEYTTFHGGTVNDALSAITTTVNRVAGIYEDELAVSFTLIGSTDQVIYENGATDPYSNDDGFSMLGQNQSNLDSVIGSVNYDIGHVFSTGGGGVASLGSVCSGSSKARGVTGLPNPVGDPFDVDFVSHEMGHQFGGNHTFDSETGSCGGGNRADSAAFEPGSGSTIMAYAGICGGDNLQPNSDAYFHTHSFDEMSTFVGSGGGASCGSVSSLSNTAPVADAGTGGMTIPADTPFMLSGNATDADNDTLRYRWEQHDLRSGSSGASPSDTSGNAPIFRSFSASTEPVRVFPKLDDLLNNTQTIGEILPPDTRSLSFRLTALDDHDGGGGVDYDEIAFDVDGNSGPFLVTAPNTAVTWAEGATQTVTWDVAGTAAAPVSCAAVDIDLSTDGGQTFDVSLASGTANDGSELITVPNAITTQARLRVMCSDNIFFDLSNADFTIEASGDDFSVAVSPASQDVCTSDTAALDVAVGQLGAFGEVVALSAGGHGGNAVFTQNDQVPPFNSELQLSNLSAGDLTVTVTGTATSGTRQDTADLSVVDPLAAAPGLLSPDDGTTLGSLTPQLQWAAVNGAGSYLVEIDDQSNFSSPVLSQTVAGTSLSVAPGVLQADTLYNWRVTAANICGQQASATRQFTTPNTSCQTVASSDVPVLISSSGSVTVTSDLTISGSGEIVDVNVVDLTIAHSWVSDLTISLTAPSNTTVDLVSQTCDDEDNVLISFDDEAGSAAGSWPCPPADGGSYQPENPLSAFDGEDANGTWQLTVNDAFNQDGGQIDAWSLEVCSIQVSSPAPIFEDRFEQ